MRRLWLKLVIVLIVCGLAVAARARPIDVKIEAQMALGPNGVLVRGTTNLPSGTSLAVSLVGGAGARMNGILVSDTQIDNVDATVKGGSFQIARPLGYGRRLKPGAYVLKISCMPMLQPPSVEKALGHNGENLAGKFAHQEGRQRVISYTANVELK